MPLHISFLKDKPSTGCFETIVITSTMVGEKTEFWYLVPPKGYNINKQSGSALLFVFNAKKNKRSNKDKDKDKDKDKISSIIMKLKKDTKHASEETRIEKEKKILQKINHNNIIEMVNVLSETTIPNFYFICTTKMRTSLETHINDIIFNFDTMLAIKNNSYVTNHYTYSFVFLLNNLIKLIDAVEYLNKKGILHRDIKADNVVVDIDHSNLLIAKIIDFDVSVELSEENKHLSNGYKFCQENKSSAIHSHATYVRHYIRIKNVDLCWYPHVDKFGFFSLFVNVFSRLYAYDEMLIGWSKIKFTKYSCTVRQDGYFREELRSYFLAKKNIAQRGDYSIINFFKAKHLSINPEHKYLISDIIKSTIKMVDDFYCFSQNSIEIKKTEQEGKIQSVTEQDHKKFHNAANNLLQFYSFDNTISKEDTDIEDNQPIDVNEELFPVTCRWF